MILKIPGTPIEIDTAHNTNGAQWVSVWMKEGFFGSFKSLDEAVNAIQEHLGLDDEGIVDLQQRGSLNVG